MPYIVLASGQNVDREYFGRCLRILLNNNKNTEEHPRQTAVTACVQNGVKEAKQRREK